MDLVINILTNTVVPIFVLIVLGYAIGSKYELHLPSLSKFYFNVLMPCYLLVNLYSAEVTGEMLWVFIFTVVLYLALFVISTIAGRLKGMTGERLGAFTNSVMFYNAGNMGVPLITLAFAGSPLQSTAITAQIMVMLFQNTGSISLGIVNVARSKVTDLKGLVRRIISMPSIWILPVALAARYLPFDLRKLSLIWTPATYASEALVATALITLGVQLSQNRGRIKDKAVILSTAMRLVGGPLIAWPIIRLMGFSGFLAQVLFVSSAAPTAVNTALVAVEFDSEAQYASQTVLLTTAMSAVTLAPVIFLARLLFPL